MLRHLVDWNLTKQKTGQGWLIKTKNTFDTGLKLRQKWLAKLTLVPRPTKGPGTCHRPPHLVAQLIKHLDLLRTKNDPLWPAITYINPATTFNFPAQGSHDQTSLVGKNKHLCFSQSKRLPCKIWKPDDNLNESCLGQGPLVIDIYLPFCHVQSQISSDTMVEKHSWPWPHPRPI